MFSSHLEVLEAVEDMVRLHTSKQRRVGTRAEVAGIPTMIRRWRFGVDEGCLLVVKRIMDRQERPGQEPLCFRLTRLPFVLYFCISLHT